MTNEGCCITASTAADFSTLKGMIEQTLKGKSKIIQPEAVNGLLKMLKTKLFETKTVGQLIRGYKDPLMALAKIFLPNIIKDDKFSLLNGVSGGRTPFLAV